MAMVCRHAERKKPIPVLADRTPGQHCTKCEKGKLYRIKEPAVIIRITGHAPPHATVNEMERFRYNLCGEVFTTEVPPEVRPDIGRRSHNMKCAGARSAVNPHVARDVAGVDYGATVSSIRARS